MRVAISRASTRPTIETARAASFRVGCIDITGVLRGSILDVISCPAMMLPHASRLIGLITDGLFSLMGGKGPNRGCPIETKKMTRRL